LRSAGDGLIARCKTGDGVLKVGPDYVAKDALIACEAKDVRGYKLPDMLAEIEEARRNRGATFGIFIISTRCAPAGLPPFMRYGNDTVIVKWNDEDEATDVYLDATVDVACALVTREAAEKKDQRVDFAAINRTIDAIERSAGAFDQIITWTTTIETNSGKILKEAKSSRDALNGDLTVLRSHMKALRGSGGATA